MGTIFAKIFRLKDIFNPRPFNPRLFNHELSNPGIFKPKSWVEKSGAEKSALQMFCLLNSQMNACEPNPNSTCSVIKNFYLHAIFKMWYMPL